MNIVNVAETNINSDYRGEEGSKMKTEKTRRQKLIEAKEDVVTLIDLVKRVKGKDKRDVQIELAKARLYKDVLEAPILFQKLIKKETSVLAGKFKRCVAVVNVAVILTLLYMVLAGCKATAGLGQDITWFGEAGERMLKYESRK